ncbi:MATE family efflux transporter [Clostridium estertheticum]|uniref:MATE family efflux transporter n=1 Tax=Clostridium estertheticum TaxID=238834 RepID=UPI0013EE695C|nr:MATE family efflux transporter [Clostridium estertheticum]MBZ9607268.1 MATE family efflux transporter [Clostridium estertheticum]
MEKLFSKKLSFMEFIKFVSPAIISMVFISLYTIIDGIFVAQFVGSDALASINIVLPIISVLCGIGIMFATGGSALISISMGENKYEEANSRFSLMLLVTLVIGVFISVFGYIYQEEIFKLLGATDELMPYVKGYGIIFLVTAPIFIVKILFEYFLRAEGAFNFSMFISILGGIINIIFDYIFMVIFDMGIVGAALATILGAFITLIIAFFYFMSSKSTLKYVIPKFNFKIILESATNGLSEMVTELSAAITTILFNFVAMKFAGADGVAAVTVVLYAHFLMTSTYLGFVCGVAPMVSFNYGVKNEDKLKEIHSHSKKFILISSVLIFIVCLAFAPFIVGFFASPDSDVFNIALNGLQLFSVAFLFVGANIYVSGIFTAYSNGKISAIVSFSRAFVFVIIGFMFLPNMLGINGVWIIVPFAEFITIGLSILFIKKYKQVYMY